MGLPVRVGSRRHRDAVVGPPSHFVDPSYSGRGTSMSTGLGTVSSFAECAPRFRSNLPSSRIPSARPIRNSYQPCKAEAHLRNPFWRNKRPSLDSRQPRLGQPLNQLDFRRQRDRLLFVLQAIARSHLDQLDPVALRRRLLAAGRREPPLRAEAGLPARSADRRSDGSHGRCRRVAGFCSREAQGVGRAESGELRSVSGVPRRHFI